MDRSTSGCVPCHALHTDELEGPEGAIPADPLEATDGDEVAGVAEGVAQIGGAGSIEPGSASIGPGSRQNFRKTSLGWTQKMGVYVIWVGQDVVALESQLAAANQHVAQLEAQVQQLQDQPAPAPVTTPPDPKATEALSALVELAKALRLVVA